MWPRKTAYNVDCLNIRRHRRGNVEWKNEFGVLESNGGQGRNALLTKKGRNQLQYSERAEDVRRRQTSLLMKLFVTTAGFRRLC